MRRTALLLLLLNELRAIVTVLLIWRATHGG
jgi:hypothetical protein